MAKKTAGANNHSPKQKNKKGKPVAANNHSPKQKSKKGKPVAANNNLPLGEVCEICGQVHEKLARKDLGIKATSDEVESLILINNRVQVAAQTARPANLPPNVDPQTVQIFVQAALNAQAEAQLMQRGWWQEILEKYPQLPKDKNVLVDFNTCEFYVFEKG